MIFQSTILFAFFVQTPTSVGLEFQKAVEIGKRVAMVQHSLPLVNQVVLVPDEATYLDELSKFLYDTGATEISLIHNEEHA